MNWKRIFAIVLRNIYSFRRNYDRLFDAFYWSSMDIIIWGLTSSYIMKLSTHSTNIILLVISGITFWLIVTRAQYETNVSLLDDIWSRNLINIFVSPLKFSEWIIAVVIIGVMKALITFFMAILVSFIMYKIQIFSYGFYLVPFVLSLLMTGWWVSFFITGTILRYGTNVQTFAWTLVYLLAPFSGIYYPITNLPLWIQYISKILPTTYVFDGIRSIVLHGTVNPENLIISFALNSIYLVLGILYLRRSYVALLQRGMMQIN